MFLVFLYYLWNSQHILDFLARSMPSVWGQADLCCTRTIYTNAKSRYPLSPTISTSGLLYWVPTVWVPATQIGIDVRVSSLPMYYSVLLWRRGLWVAVAVQLTCNRTCLYMHELRLCRTHLRTSRFTQHGFILIRSAYHLLVSCAHQTTPQTP